MIIFKKAGDIHEFLEQKKKKGSRVGFSPTMGALHTGHLSLVTESKKHNDVSVASIFVNPTQFNDPVDFQKYPITLEKDISMFEAAGCDVLFIPLVQEMYPNGIVNLEHYDLGFLETILEGKFRPGHFQGVSQVVHRLLDIVLPHNLYLGQKDYQQCMVIKKMTELVGLAQIKVNVCPTLREDDGLAMSSRNTRLSPADRKKAATISAALRYIKENIKQGSLKSVKQQATQMLLQNDFRPDYVEVADANSLELIDEWDGKQKIVALIAAFINDVRLIDNMEINE
jgi:pantoate--beta-alanine ligase